jgi:hypothetical protein
MSIIYLNLILEEIRKRVNSGNIFYHSHCGPLEKTTCSKCEEEIFWVCTVISDRHQNGTSQDSGSSTAVRVHRGMY